MKKFKPIFLENYTVDDAWFDILNAIYTYGKKYEITSGSYKGEARYSLDYIAGYIHNPHEPKCPYVPPNFGLPAPTSEEEIEEYFLNYLLNGVTAENEHYKYGTFLVGGELRMPPIHHTITKFYTSQEKKLLSLLGRGIAVPNMIEWVIHHFKEHGYGNEHCYINVGYPELNLGYEVPYKDETERLTSPCLRGIGFKVIEDDNGNFYLQTDVVFRSWDAVGGWPTNIGGIALLNQYVATFLPRVNPGPIAYSSKGIHAYSFHKDYMEIRLNKKRE